MDNSAIMRSTDLTVVVWLSRPGSNTDDDMGSTQGLGGAGGRGTTSGVGGGGGGGGVGGGGGGLGLIDSEMMRALDIFI